MKPRLLFVVAAMPALAAVACLDHQDPSDTACAGYLGCSAGQRIGDPGAAAEPTAANISGASPASASVTRPGAACGKPLPADTPATVPGTAQGYKHYTVMASGVTLAGTLPAKAGPRTFWVRVPADYDPFHPYRVVYVGQGCDGYEVANTATLPLYDEALGGTEQAIYVALDIPRDGAHPGCYDDRDGPASQEWEAFQLFQTVVDQNYCVDNSRIYASGFDSGARLANMWGCSFAGDGARFAPGYHVRGQATVAGGEPANQPPCNGPVAAIFIHDTTDDVDALAGSLDALARVGQVNGCDTTYDPLGAQIPPTTTGTNQTAANQTPWHPEIPALGNFCSKFIGCPDNAPVVFCTTHEFGHSDQRERATAAFRLFFDEVE